jgi:hypothetical protein
MLSHEDEQCMKLGREIVRMIRDLAKTAGRERGYALRRFTYPGGEAHIIVANHAEVADVMDKAAAKVFAIAEATPPSEVN